MCIYLLFEINRLKSEGSSVGLFLYNVGILFYVGCGVLH